MRFSTLHKTVSYLLVGTSLLALALSGELAPALLIAAAAAFMASWFWEPRTSSRLGPRIWTAATIALLGYTLVDVLTSDAPTLLSAVQFLLFLVANRLFNRRTSRDYLQLYVLSFVTLVAAAAFNTDLSFALCFVLYIVAATWAMILLHLRREMEENYLLRHTVADEAGRRVEVQRILASKRIVSGRFLFGTSILSILVFVASGLLFFLFPRVGFGLMFGKSRAGLSMAGFSERVELGQFGRIRDNPAVVMRVELANLPTDRRLDWHWRGISFDHYDGRTWRKDAPGFKQLPRGREIRQFLVRPDVDLRGAKTARVYLEPISDSGVLFTPGRALAIQLPEKRTYTRGDPRYVRRDALGDLSVDGDPTTSRSYDVTFTLEEPTAAVLSRPAPPISGRFARRYLQLPRLAARVSDLARRITAGARHAYDRAIAVLRYLRAEYQYTLDLRRNEQFEPLEDFLFEQRAGHCEYFATAMAILLRVVGVPTRNVNGFLGGEFNPYGRYWIVRQGDAHSWVEVYLGAEFGWLPFDPTPPDARALSQKTGFWDTVAAWIDSLRLKWYKYVIEYDLGKQVSLFKGLAAWLRETFGASGGSGLGTLLRSPGGLVAIGLACLALAIWLIRRRRGWSGVRRKKDRHTREITDLYIAAVELLRKQGYPKGDAETPLAYAKRLSTSSLPAAPDFAQLTSIYNAVRFGGKTLIEQDRLAVYEATRKLASIRRPA